MQEEGKHPASKGIDRKVRPDFTFILLARRGSHNSAYTLLARSGSRDSAYTLLAGSSSRDSTYILLPGT